MPLKLTTNSVRVDLRGGGGGVCVLVVCRDHAATVRGRMSTLWLRRSAPLGALARRKPSPVPTELDENQTGIWDGIVPSPALQ